MITTTHTYHLVKRRILRVVYLIIMRLRKLKKEVVYILTSRHEWVKTTFIRQKDGLVAVC